MPELTYSDEELGLTPGWDEHLDPNIRRELREGRIARRKLAKAETKLAEQKRLEAFRRAGVPDDKRGEIFTKTYKGDEDPSAIKAEFESLFGVQGDGEGGSGTLSPEELEAQRRVARAGGDQSGTAGAIPLEEAIRNAKSSEEVKAIIQAAYEQHPQAGIKLPDIY